MKKFLNNNKFHVLYLILIAIAIFIGLRGYLHNDLVIGNDLKFHLSRIQGFSNFWRSPVNFNTFDNRGKAVSLFYPPYVLYFSHIIFHFTNSISKSIKYYTLAITLLSGVLSYYAGMKIYKNEHKSFIFSILYVCAQYNLSNIYLRAAVGEYSAAAFLPLVILGAYYLFFENSKKWKIIVIGTSLVMYCHILTTIIIAMIVVTLFISSLIFKRELWNKQRFINCIYAIAFTIICSLCILLPMLEQTKSYEYFFPVPYYTFSSKTSSIFNFIKLNTNIALLPNVLGPVIMLTVVFNIIIFKKMNVFEKVLFSFALLFIIMQINIFPWRIFDFTKVLTIQYLYRLNVFINLISSFIFAKYFIDYFIENKVKYVVFVTLSLLAVNVMVMYSSVIDVTSHVNNQPNMIQYLPKEDSKRHSEKQVLRVLKSYSSIDYFNILQVKPYMNVKLKNGFMYPWGKKHLKGSRNWQKLLKKTILLDDKFKKLIPIISDDKYELKFSNSSNAKTIQIPISIYKGINILVNNVDTKPKLSSNGRLLINLPKSKNVDIAITYRWTLIARISQVVSLLTFMILLAWNTQVFRKVVLWFNAVKRTKK